MSKAFAKSMSRLSASSKGSYVQTTDDVDDSTALQVERKLRKHKRYQELGGPELQDKVEELIKVDRILEKFSHIVEEVLLNEVERLNLESNDDFVCSIEVSAAKSRQKSRHTNVARIPLKITVRDLKSNAKVQRMYDSFATNIWRLDYGAKHISLTVKDVVLEWGVESLVDPYFESPPKHPSVNSDARDISIFSSHDHLAVAGAPEEEGPSLWPIEEEIEHLLYVSSEKKKIFERLAEVISRYNRQHYYDARRRNCQTFVKDALTAIGITERVVVTQQESKPLRQLRAKKSKNIPDSFGDHDDLDTFVWSKSPRQLSEIDRESLEYLQLTYSYFHGDDECHMTNCRLFLIEEALNDTC